jgi:hypothetical protein
MRSIGLVNYLKQTRQMRSMVMLTRPMRPMRPTRLLVHLIVPLHIYSVAVIFSGATFTCGCTVDFTVADVVEIKGRGKIE